MYIFDFNVHLTYLNHPDVNEVINQDLTLGIEEISKGFEIHKEEISKCNGANILLFNTKLFTEDVSTFFKDIESSISFVKYTALLDFRNKNVYEYIDNLALNGVNAIMFNSYLQQISESDFNEIIKICRYAEQKKLIICIDGSYGTSKMYSYNNMKLACCVADFISKTPIVIVHAGGARIIEAMLLAADKSNVWLDTSFSLPYYLGSSIEVDFDFAIKKLKFDKIIFGSDHPYIVFEEALNKHLDFFARHNFKDCEISMIMGENALKLFNV